MKKILYLITQSELGGAQRYIFDLAKNLKNEYEISVGFGEPYEEGELARQLDGIGIKHYSLPHLVRSLSLWQDWLALFDIIKLIREIKPDIIHLNSSKISVLGSLAILFFKIQNSKFKIGTVYTVHGWVFNEPHSLWKKWLYFYSEKLSALWKDKVICIDKLDYKIAKDELKIPEKKLALIYHGLDAGEYQFPEPAVARGKLLTCLPPEKQPPKTDVLIGSIGNLYKTKGYEYFLEAVKLLNEERGLAASAIIIGDGPERADLKTRAENMADGKVHFTGRLPHAAELVPAFDVYICSSVKEGFPYTILEAMSAGAAIVSTNVGGIPDVIGDGENGLLCEPRDARALAGRIAELIRQPELKQKIAQRAKRDVAEKFQLDRMIEETKKLYET